VWNSHVGDPHGAVRWQASRAGRFVSMLAWTWSAVFTKTSVNEKPEWKNVHAVVAIEATT